MSTCSYKSKKEPLLLFIDIHISARAKKNQGSIELHYTNAYLCIMICISFI